MSILACLRKRKFSSESACMSVIFKLRARNQDTEKLKPYLCDFCRRWHLGHHSIVAPQQAATSLSH